jgi:hypothetical protein
MFPQQSSRSRRLLTIVLSAALLMPASAFSADRPQPTPRPGTLGAYAQKITLDRSSLGDPSGTVILTNDTVVGFTNDGAITLGTVVTVQHDPSKASSGGSSAERARWRAAHGRQQRVIADLEKQHSLLEIEIGHLEKQQLTPKILARIDRAEAKRRFVEREISRAREELARIVRDARRQGAEPGWFR